MKHKKKVLFVLYSAGIGGDELHSIKLNKSMNINSYFVFLSFNRKDILEELNSLENVIEIKNIGFKGFPSIGSIKRLNKFVKENGIEIIYTAGFYPAYFGAIAKILNKKVKLITSIKEKRPWKKFYHEPLIYFINKISDIIETNSIDIFEELIGKRGLKDKVRYIPNLTSDEIIKSNDFNLILNDKIKFKIGVVANIRPVKNIELFLSISKKIINIRKDVGFIIVGRDKNGIIKEFISENALNDYIYHIEKIDYYKIGGFYKFIDIFLLTSRYEGSPNVIFEAMANGLPLLVSKIPATKELVKDDFNGYRCGIKDSDCFVNRIIRIIENPELRKRLSLNSLNYFKEKFSKEKVLKIYKEIFDIDE